MIKVKGNVHKVRVTSPAKWGGRSNYISTEKYPGVDREFTTFIGAVKYACDKATNFPLSEYAVVEILPPKELFTIKGTEND